MQDLFNPTFDKKLSYQDSLEEMTNSASIFSNHGIKNSINKRNDNCKLK